MFGLGLIGMEHTHFEQAHQTEVATVRVGEACYEARFAGEKH